jgi:hypothetical protein
MPAGDEIAQGDISFRRNHCSAASIDAIQQSCADASDSVRPQRE